MSDHGGFRIDTREEGEYCRWIFASPDPAVSALAGAIDQSGRLIKLCDTREILRALIPDHWQLHAPGFFMTAGTVPAHPSLAAGYRSRTVVDGAVSSVAILDSKGALAASGFAAHTAHAFVYDRIVTAPDHRRRGLASYVMAALRATCTGPPAAELLVATEAGHRLYAHLGWRLLSPYATASLPAA